MNGFLCPCGTLLATPALLVNHYRVAHARRISPGDLLPYSRADALEPRAALAPRHEAAAMTTSTAHCMTCKKQMPTVNVTRVTYPNGRVAERGTCTCGTKTSKFVKAGS